MKSKRFFVMLLAVILLVVCAIPSVYSWYDHNGSQTGDRMKYTRNDLPVSAGVVSIETKRYNTEKEHNELNGLSDGDSNKLYYDIKGNKEYAGSALDNSGDTIAKKITHFYGTTITNSGSAPAYVNLYLSNFTNSPNVKIGTLQPSLTHKGLSSSVHLTNENMVRIYFQFDKANNWNHQSAAHYLVYKTKDGATGRKTITDQIDNTKDTGNILKGITTYYVDLPGDATEFFFATDGNNSGFKTTDNTVSMPWYRTKTITNIHAETGYYLTGVADDTTWNAQYNTFNIPGGVSVKTYFDTLDINKNQHAYVTLNQGTNYTGASAAYTAVQDSGITVNGNTGYVTASSSYSSNTTITTTITGSLGDTTTVTTAVSNPDTVNATVALNVEVPGKTVNDDNEEVNGTAEIVWYIDNSKGSDDVQFSNVYYTK